MLGSPYKSMQVDFYQRVTKIGITNKNRQVNAVWANPIAMAAVFDASIFFGTLTCQAVQVVALSFYAGIDSYSHRD